MSKLPSFLHPSLPHSWPVNYLVLTARQGSWVWQIARDHCTLCTIQNIVHTTVYTLHWKGYPGYSTVHCTVLHTVPCTVPHSIKSLPGTRVLFIISSPTAGKPLGTEFLGTGQSPNLSCLETQHYRTGQTRGWGLAGINTPADLVPWPRVWLLYGRWGSWGVGGGLTHRLALLCSSLYCRCSGENTNLHSKFNCWT